MRTEPSEVTPVFDVFVVGSASEQWLPAVGALEAQGYRIVLFDSAADFLATDHTSLVGVVIFNEVDDERRAFVLDHCKSSQSRLLPILASASIEIAGAVSAMRAGAFDVIRGSGEDDFCSSVRTASEWWRSEGQPGRPPTPVPASAQWPELTRRQREILTRVLKGQPNKIIAADLGISQRTAENHRAQIMKKMGASSISNLVQAAMGSTTPREHPSFAPRNPA